MVGTASLRRQAQTLNLRPDLNVVSLRGSVQTRLRRLAEGAIDATFLAMAGLARLGLGDRATSVVSMDVMPPAAGQGALAIVCRQKDHMTLNSLARLTLPEFEVATIAERAFLDALDGSCRTPIGAYAKVASGVLTFVGEVLTSDGRRRWRRTDAITLGATPRADAAGLGHRLGAEIIAEAGPSFRAEVAARW